MAVERNHDESNKAWYQAAVGTATVAAMFSLIVSALLVFNYFQRLHADPLNSEELAALKDALVAAPKNEAIKGEVRGLDLRLRQKYFRHREISRKGAYLLLVDIVVFLIAIKSAAAYRKKLPMPEANIGELVSETRSAMMTRWSVAAFGVIAGGTLLVLAITPRGHSTREFLTAIETGNRPETASYPTQKEIQKNWSRFRGPGGLGISAYTNVPSTWNGQTGEGVLWKAPVPLPGENSPVVWENRVFLTGATEDTREVYCFDADSGKLLWERAVENIPGSPSEPPTVMEDTGFAAPAAVTDGQRVYAIFANGDVIAFNFEGKQVWARNLGLPQNSYGHASSLTMYQNLLLVLLDHGYSDDGLSRLIAVEGHSGRTVWQTPRPVRSSWASPIVINTEQSDQVITSGDPWVIAYDPTTGAELWRADCLGGDVAPSPIYANGLVYAVQADAYLAAIRPDGHGDVTQTHIAWTADEGLPDICSPLSNGELVFVLTSYSGFLSCYDAQDGTLVWQKDLDAAFKSSPSLVGNRVYLISGKGVMFIVAAGREYRELGRAELGEDSNTCPAFLDGRIYIRGKKNLYCIGES